MGDGSAIEWTDATWNPVTGCSVVSPGCTNCYAMKLAGGRMRNHDSRKGLTTDSKAGPVWTGEVRLNEDWLDQPLRWKRPRRIFVCAHGDLFHESVPDDWIDRVFAVMASSYFHTFQVLTKRPERMRDYLRGLEREAPERLRHYVVVTMAPGRAARQAFNPPMSEPDPPTAELRALYGRVNNYDWRIRGGLAERHWQAWPLSNVWLGVSVEDQARANERIPPLLDTPAAVRFVSAEPLLGPVDLTVDGLSCWDCPHCADGSETEWDTGANGCRRCEGSGKSAEIGLDWLIAGGESGPGARPMHPDWARSLRDQCQVAGVPFFFKQWGEWAPHVGAVDGWTINDDPEISRFEHREWEDGRWSEPFWPMWCDFEDGNYDEEQCVSRIGKKNAGRDLDGRTHDGFPEAPATGGR